MAISENLFGVLTGTTLYILTRFGWGGGSGDGPGKGQSEVPFSGEGQTNATAAEDIVAHQQELQVAEQRVNALQQEYARTQHTEVAKRLETAQREVERKKRELEEARKQMPPYPVEQKAPRAPRPRGPQAADLALRLRSQGTPYGREQGWSELDPYWIFQMEEPPQSALGNVEDGDIPWSGKLLDPFGNVTELAWPPPDVRDPQYAKLVGVEPGDKRLEIGDDYHPVAKDPSYAVFLKIVTASIIRGADQLRKAVGPDARISPSLWVVLPNQLTFRYVFNKTFSLEMWDGSVRSDVRWVTLNLSGLEDPQRASNLGLYEVSSSEIQKYLNPLWENWMATHGVEKLQDGPVYHLACVKKKNPGICRNLEEAIREGRPYRSRHGSPGFFSELYGLPQDIWRLTLRWRLFEVVPVVKHVDLSKEVREIVYDYYKYGNPQKLRDMGVNLDAVEYSRTPQVQYVVKSKAPPTFHRAYRSREKQLPRLSRITQFLSAN